MTRAISHIAGAAVAAFTALAAIQPANAVPIEATGSFTLAGLGASTVNTGNIATNTASKTDPPQLVTAVDGTFSAGIAAGDNGSFSPQPIEVPQPIGTTVDINDFALTINGIVFTFTTGVTESIIATNTATGTAGFINSEYQGTITDGNGIFINGTTVDMSETCTQPTRGGAAGLITCTNAFISVTEVPEPASLALLGAGLIALAPMLRRRRKTA